jgi:hypothetical protein
MVRRGEKLLYDKFAGSAELQLKKTGFCGF